jgi:adenylyltransferase/sulfurtransferase
MGSSPHVPLQVSCRDVKDRIDRGESFLLLDCRESDEHALARIEGSVLIPMGELPDRLAEIQEWRDKSIIIHCHHGGRSLNVATWLRQQGFDAAQSMLGGIEEWALRIDPRVGRY